MDEVIVESASASRAITGQARDQAIRPSRDPYFDNARFLLVALVVAGHAVEPLIEQSRFVRAGFLLLYAFHVPAFAFVAGRFSRASLGRGDLAKLGRSVLAPYVVFQALYVLFREVVLGRAGPVFFTPCWLMWFLFSLACWKLLLPLVLRLPAILALTIAIAAGLGAGALPHEISYAFSLSRTLVFFPFFLAGHLCSGADLARLATPRVRSLYIAIFAVGGAVAWWLAPALFAGWLYGGQSYASLGAGMAEGAAIRALVYLVGFVLGAAFLALVPRRATFFSAWGSRSLQGYLLHGFVVKGAVAAGAFTLLGPGASALVATALAMLLAAALCWRPLPFVVDPVGAVVRLVRRSSTRGAARPGVSPG